MNENGYLWWITMHLPMNNTNLNKINNNNVNKWFWVMYLCLFCWVIHYYTFINYTQINIQWICTYQTRTNVIYSFCHLKKSNKYQYNYIYSDLFVYLQNFDWSIYIKLEFYQKSKHFNFARSTSTNICVKWVH